MKIATYKKIKDSPFESKMSDLNEIVVNNNIFVYDENVSFYDKIFINKTNTISLHNTHQGTWFAKTSLLSTKGYSSPKEAIDELKKILNDWLEEAKNIETILKELE